MTPANAALLRDADLRDPAPASETARSRKDTGPRLAVLSEGAAPAGSPAADGPALWRDGRFETDEWAVVGPEEAIGAGPSIVPLERLLAEIDALAPGDASLGVLVQPNEAVEELAPLLDRVAVVALVFPKYTDGRAMSAARLLRERYGFKGELRATGDVLIDQMPLMRRCGFDAFEVTDRATRAQLAAGKWPDIPFYMQPVGSSMQGEAPAGSRPWARRLVA
jgi:uncharacterized protein (DUF934 family)